jgi:hypothetical protein
MFIIKLPCLLDTSRQTEVDACSSAQDSSECPGGARNSVRDPEVQGVAPVVQCVTQ